MTPPAAPGATAAPRPEQQGAVAGLDPGSAKCGLVLTDPSRRRVLRGLVLPPDATWRMLREWHEWQGLQAVVIGDGTGGRLWRDRLAELVPLVLVDEHGTTAAARHRYWQLFPPRGWRRWLPEGLRRPPRDWDDVVAQLLLERWLGRELVRDGDAGAPRALRTRPAP